MGLGFNFFPMRDGGENSSSINADCGCGSLMSITFANEHLDKKQWSILGIFAQILGLLGLVIEV